MPENIFKNNSNAIIEQEIAELSALIDKKRSQLETEHNIVSDKELIKETLVSDFTKENGEQGGVEGYQVSPPSNNQVTLTGSYLDNLDNQSVETVNLLINEVPKRGLRATLKSLTTQMPFIVDAVHDVLVDSLYNEMTEKGYLK